MQTRALTQWLIVPALLLACIACNKGGGKAAHNGAGAGGQSASAQGGQADAGRAVYAANNCATCHGAELEGNGKLAPGLRGIKAYWSAEELAKYLRNPQAYKQDDPRLTRQQADYSMLMPAVPMTAQDYRTLAEWLLTQ